MSETNERYPAEVLDEDWDDGTMPENVASLAEKVIGHRIVAASKVNDLPDNDLPDSHYGYYKTGAVLTLDDGTQVRLRDTADCCAYTELREFLLHPEMVDHIITGVGTSDDYQTWHIYADAGDVAELTVGWSCGNPFYYGYGFSIEVVPVGQEQA